MFSALGSLYVLHRVFSIPSCIVSILSRTKVGKPLVANRILVHEDVYDKVKVVSKSVLTD